MKQNYKGVQKLQLNKSTVARLNVQQLRRIEGGGEAEAEFTSIFACKSRKCATESPTLATCSCTTDLPTMI